MVLSTLHRCCKYKAKDEKWVAKFMPRYDGPYLVMDASPEMSMVMVELLNNTCMFPMFHSSQALPFVENDKELFPGWEHNQPAPVIINNKEEYFIDQILDEQK